MFDLSSLEKKKKMIADERPSEREIELYVRSAMTLVKDVSFENGVEFEGYTLLVPLPHSYPCGKLVHQIT